MKWSFNGSSLCHEFPLATVSAFPQDSSGQIVEAGYPHMLSDPILKDTLTTLVFEVVCVGPSGYVMGQFGFSRQLRLN